MLRFLLLLLGLALVASCGPAAFIEADGRAAYNARKPDLEAVVAKVEAGLDSVPHFGVPAEQVPCLPFQAPDGTAPEMVALLADADCVLQRQSIEASRGEAVRAFPVAELASDPAVIGVEVAYTWAGNPTRYLLWTAEEARPGYRNDAVRAEQGVDVDGRRLGWGLYQDATQDAYRPGIEVITHLKRAATDVELIVFLWSDDGGA